MMLDYKFKTGTEYGRPISRSRRRLMLIPLMAMAVTGLYAALTEIPSRSDSTHAVGNPNGKPVTLPLALPAPAAQAESDIVAPRPQSRLSQPKPAPETKTESSTPIGNAGAMEPPAASKVALTTAPKSPVLAASVAESTQPVSVYTQPAHTAPGKWIEHEVRPGDTLAGIFSDAQLSAKLLHKILHASSQTKRLNRIVPGQKIRLRVDAQNSLHELIYEIHPARSLQIVAHDGSFTSEMLERPIEHRTSQVTGTIDSSLFISGKDAGLSDTKIMELANIFAWDIDFALEIRSGDAFTVIYQEEFLDGEKLGDGPILAAEFINRGKSYRAVRYLDKQGHSRYFTPEGKSVQKSFLRMPVKFARISSRFNPGRKHPILNRIRAHKGVDYAAPKGTPVRASGDGKIAFKGRKGGYGKTLILEHGGGISTLYAHLSGYSNRVRKGNRVRQGQTIGYVGKTGLATGPHLHYEFRVNGVHRNPLTVKLPAAKSIAKNLRRDFLSQTQPLVAQLEILAKTMVASAQ